MLRQVVCRHSPIWGRVWMFYQCVTHRVCAHHLLQPANYRRVHVLSPLSAAHNVKKVEHWYKNVFTPWRTESELVIDLLDNIIYEDENILVLNKPNGLPMHAFRYSEKMTLDIPPPECAELSVSNCIPRIQNQLKIARLVPIFSQMRLASGVVILVKNEQAERKLKKYFAHVRASRTLYQQYLAVTVGIPHENENECKKALSRMTLGEHVLSVPESTVSNKSRREHRLIHPTVRHTVLDVCRPLNCALVRLEAHTTKWEFLQFYLSEVLSPALGDHVYSSRVCTVLGKAVRKNPRSTYPAPQVVPVDALNALNVKKKETLNIPLHLHCHQVVVPNLSTRERHTLTLHAPVPDFYKETIERLNLELPQTRS